MKVVLFCGGLGMRMREYSESIPKPMVNIGYRPILWNVMKYYAHYGHKEFILCLGYKGDMIKKYFLDYDETVSNDFTLKGNGQHNLTLMNTDIHDWTITFVDTGLKSNIAERLTAVKSYLDGEEYFLANYTDGLTDLDLSTAIRHAVSSKRIASFVAVKPAKSFDIVKFNNEGEVTGLQHINQAGIWINGGYFTFKSEIFDYIKPGEEIVYEPFSRLIKEMQLSIFKYDGFWISMDTYKEKQMIDELHAQGSAPWEVWRSLKHLKSNYSNPEAILESV